MNKGTVIRLYDVYFGGGGDGVLYNVRIVDSIMTMSHYICEFKSIVPIVNIFFEGERIN